MSCPTPLMHSMYADGALAPHDATELERHLEGCDACRVKAAASASEARALRTLLQSDGLDSLPVPPLERPLGAGTLLLALAGAGAGTALAGAAWNAVGAAVPAALRWLNPFAPGALLDAAIALFFFLTREGMTMLASMADLTGMAVVAACLVAAARLLLRRRRGGAALASLAVAAVALPDRGEAIEIRRGMPVQTVAAGDTVDDTLIVFGESVAIDGNVTGDVLAFAERVTVRGAVGGDLITAAATVTVEGAVAGNVIGFGRDVTFTGARVTGNVYAFGGDVTLGTATDVNGNAVAAAVTVALHGRVGIDFLGWARNLELRGEVARHVEAYAENVTVLPQARIGGNLTAHVPEERNLRTSSGADIQGSIDTRESRGDGPWTDADRNEYLTPSFYVWQAVRFGAAFVVGLLLLWLVPALRALPLSSAVQVLKAAGLGFVAAVVLPVAAIIAFVTILGIPLGLVALFAWLLGLYFAKIVVAQQIGRTLFTAPHGVPHYAATLLAGLVVVLVAVNLPYIGGVVNVALTLIGLGLIAAQVMGRLRPAMDQPSLAR